MNKGRRTEISGLKHKRRLKALSLSSGDHYCYKAQGKPCSCFLCSSDKYKRSVKHKKNRTIIYPEVD